MHPNAKDLTGQRFGKLVAIKATSRRYRGKVIWETKCDCGKICYSTAGSLASGNSKSCGCATKKDLTGMRFGGLLAIEPTNKRSGSSIMWKCLCDCGKTTCVAGRNLIRGSTRSCGCLRSEIAASRGRKLVGLLNPNWNPKLTDEERIQNRDYPKYKEWRKAVFERDYYTCQKCGNKSVRLNAHHILGYADNKEERTLLSNGITLCKKCHKNYHHVYGLIATEETFNEWMNEE